jgi:3D (Asp-Asp-Asp) domain-containing protein
MRVGLYLVVIPLAATSAAEDTTHHSANHILIASVHSTKDRHRVVSETVRVVTAYNVGDPNQNSGDPCIAANGENICRALESGAKRCAANFVPFGTELFIEDHGTFVVTDRTNSRYRDRVDIAMKRTELSKARRFGKKILIVKILQKIHPVLLQ